MKRGVQLGLALSAPSGDQDWSHAIAWAEFADRLGLHSVWLPEGHFSRGATPAPLLGLAAFAARTERIRLGTTSLLLPLQHPIRIAAEVATLDALSGGRVWLGLGRGFRAPVFEGFGVEASSKRDRFDESLDAILAAWSGESLALAGEFFAAFGESSVRVPLRPVQEPHPPLLVAAFGPKGLRQAAARGLPYLASPLESLDVLAENYAQWEAQLGREPIESAPRAPIMRTAYLAPSEAEAEAVLAALAGEAFHQPRKGPQALRRAASGRLEDRVVVGTRNAVVDRLGSYRERLGLDLLVVRANVPGVAAQACRDSLQALTEEVVPAL